MLTCAAEIRITFFSQYHKHKKEKKYLECIRDYILDH